MSVRKDGQRKSVSRARARVHGPHQEVREFVDWLRQTLDKDPLYASRGPRTEATRFASFGGHEPYDGNRRVSPLTTTISW